MYHNVPAYDAYVFLKIFMGYMPRLPFFLGSDKAKITGAMAVSIFPIWHGGQKGATTLGELLGRPTG